MRALIPVTCSMLLSSLGLAAPPEGPCLVEVDLGADGSYEERKRFRYGGPATCRTPPDLELIGCPTLEETLSPAGEVLRSRTFGYDGRGDLTTVEYHRGGKLTTRLTVRWGKDLQRLEVDGGADGKIDALNTYSRKGRALIRESRMKGPAGRIALRATYHHDGRGRLLRTDTDHGADGSVEMRVTRRYQGERPEADEMRDGKGKVIGRTRFLYRCEPAGSVRSKGAPSKTR